MADDKYNDNSDGDAEQQLGFDSDNFESLEALKRRRDELLASFDDETTEIDDIEPSDFGED
ncbi:MAG: hypothetical protein HRT76_15195, partial [Halieaceae bacterium]|nr:hypothetical protein [Halieaceae bacterium]